jgi:hypothetical protein
MPGEIIRELIDKELAGNEVTPAEAAQRIVAKLNARHPGCLEQWFTDQAVHLMTREIGDLMRAGRGKAMSRAGTARFEAALEAGEDSPIGLYATWHAVNEENVRRRLADMTGADHGFVADTYRASAEADLMREAFHRTLAKKVGKRRTADVMTEEECERLLDSITRKAAGRTA